MREKMNRQMSFVDIIPKNKLAKELKGISKILDEDSEMVGLVYKDLIGRKRTDTGRTGMTAEQVLRCAVLKQYRNLTYEELAFHLEDSDAFRSFARLSMGQHPSKSVLQENIKSLRSSTWEALHQFQVRYAFSNKLEKGLKVRMDSSAIDSPIHYPLDSRLLDDGIRLITRWLIEGKGLNPTPVYRFSGHRRVAKKRVLKILNAKNNKIREAAYKDLLHYADLVRGYALAAIPELASFEGQSLPDVFYAHGLAEKLEGAVGILDRVIDQTERRVLRGEQVPASEKVVSFFECHTDIIVKGKREVQFGHKVFLTGGSSGMILDCVIERGNPADSERFSSLLKRHETQYGSFPRQVAADGGFASADNLAWAKTHGVKDMAFAKRKGLSILDMVTSHWVYKMLRNFRAGIEGNISTLKRAFGLSRCTWKGWGGFRQYVLSAVFSYNLLVMARLQEA